MNPRVLVAGVGNVLRQDDGFGVSVVERIEAEGGLGDSVRVIETGIGGIGLVQELMAGYDGLIICDAMRRGGQPGTLSVLEPKVPAVADLSAAERHHLLEDLHGAEPGRILVVAAALHVLPPRIRIVACEPANCDDAEVGLTPEVAAAVPRAIGQVRSIATVMLAEASRGVEGDRDDSLVASASTRGR